MWPFKLNLFESTFSWYYFVVWHFTKWNLARKCLSNFDSGHFWEWKGKWWSIMGGAWIIFSFSYPLRFWFHDLFIQFSTSITGCQFKDSYILPLQHNVYELLKWLIYGPNIFLFIDSRSKKDYYKILGVPSNADQKEIKKAYFNVSTLIHRSL